MQFLRALLLATVVLSIGTGVQAAGLTLDTISASAGEQVTLSLSFVAEGDMVSTVQADILVLPPLSYISTATGPAASASDKDVTASEISGGVRVVVFGLNQNSLVDGVVATITLHVAGSAADGTYPVTVTNVTAADPDAQAVAVATGNGSVVVGQPGTSRISLGSGEGTCGGIVILPLVLNTNGVDVSTVQMDVMFNAPLSFSSVEAGPVAQAADKNVTGSAITGGARVIVVGVNQNTMDDGVFAEIALAIAESAPEGNYHVNLGNPVVADPDAQGVDVTTSNGVVTVTDCNSTLGEELYLPGVAHTPGANGTVWRSDVEVCRFGERDATVDLALLHRGRQNLNPQTVRATVPGGSCTRFEDVVSTVFGLADSVGALRIASGLPVRASGRTYNLTDDGTFGSFKLATAPVDAPAFGEPWALIQLAHSTNPTVGYRTNLGFLNLGPGPIGLQVVLFAADGTELRDISVTLEGYEYTQLLRVLAPLGDVADAYAVVLSATSNARYLAGASVIDNRSGDGSSILAVPQW